MMTVLPPDIWEHIRDYMPQAFLLLCTCLHLAAILSMRWRWRMPPSDAMGRTVRTDVVAGNIHVRISQIEQFRSQLTTLFLRCGRVGPFTSRSVMCVLACTALQSMVHNARCTMPTNPPHRRHGAKGVRRRRRTLTATHGLIMGLMQHATRLTGLSSTRRPAGRRVPPVAQSEPSAAVPQHTTAGPVSLAADAPSTPHPARVQGTTRTTCNWDCARGTRRCRTCSGER